MICVSAARYGAFTIADKGGNPAGVVLIDNKLDDALSAQSMQRIAKKIGDSETVFAKELGGNMFRVKYFSPEGEITFCGHASIALGAALREEHGAKKFSVMFNDGAFELDASNPEEVRFCSPPTEHRALTDEEMNEVSSLFGIKSEEINLLWPPVIVNAGNDHVFIVLNSRERLRQLEYNFLRAQKWMRDKQFITVALAFCDNDNVIHIRNAFAYGGVYEDPATGASAAAISGYLRDATLTTSTFFKFLQGEDMGVPCQIETTFTDVTSSSISVGGKVRLIEHLQLEIDN